MNTTAILRTVCFLVLLGAPARAAEYSVRCDFFSTWLPSAKGINDADKKLLTAAFTDYCNQRSQCLVAVKTALEKADPKVTWPACTTTYPTAVLNNAVAATQDPKSLELIGFTVDEARFFAGLNGAASGVGKARDALVELKKNLDEDLVNHRDTLWPRLQAKGQVFCDKLKEAAYSPRYQAMLADTSNFIGKAKETLVNIYKLTRPMLPGGPAKPPPELVRAFMDSLQQAANRVGGWRAGARENALTEQAMSGAVGVADSFRDLKQRVAACTASYKGKEAMLADAEKAIVAFVGVATSSGQDKDAAALAEALRSVLTKLSSDYVKSFNEFDNLSQKNVGGLRSKIACEDEWKQLSSKLRSDSAKSQLEAMKRATATIFDELGDIKSEVQSQAQSSVDALVNAEDTEIKAETEDQRQADDGLNGSSKF